MLRGTAQASNVQLPGLVKYLETNYIASAVVMLCSRNMGSLFQQEHFALLLNSANLFVCILHLDICFPENVIKKKKSLSDNMLAGPVFRENTV